MACSEHRFISFDETPVFYRAFKPEADKKCFLILLHGMGEHSGRYQNFAEFLAKRGIQSFIPDLRGFGQSGGKRGFVRHFADYTKDLEALHKFLVRSNPETPIFLLGHSFGGLIASSYLSSNAENSKPAGLILSSPLFGVKLHVAVWRKVLGNLLSFCVPSFTLDNPINPQKLTHDETLIEAYKKDPQVHHKVSARLYRELSLELKKTTLMAKNISQSVLLLQAGEDQIVSKEASIAFYNSLNSKDKELEIYPSLFHEILNESSRETVFNRIADWISRRA
jgi:lysophospholipase